MSEQPGNLDADPKPDNSHQVGQVSGGKPDASSPGRPRWVYVVGIVAIVLAVMVIIMVLVGGNHGPSRHVPAGLGSGYASTIGLTAQGGLLR